MNVKLEIINYLKLSNNRSRVEKLYEMIEAYESDMDINSKNLNKIDIIKELFEKINSKIDLQLKIEDTEIKNEEGVLKSYSNLRDHCIENYIFDHISIEQFSEQFSDYIEDPKLNIYKKQKREMKIEIKELTNKLIC